MQENADLPFTIVTYEKLNPAWDGCNINSFQAGHVAMAYLLLPNI